MITVVALVCAAAAPDTCKEVNVNLDANPQLPYACMMEAPQAIQQITMDGWVIKKWSCKGLNNDAKDYLQKREYK